VYRGCVGRYIMDRCDVLSRLEQLFNALFEPLRPCMERLAPVRASAPLSTYRSPGIRAHEDNRILDL
jgi:hypothetical protein